MARWVSLTAHCRATGDTPDEVRQRITDGIWTAGTHFRQEADSTIEVSPAQYNAWVEQAPPKRTRKRTAAPEPTPAPTPTPEPSPDPPPTPPLEPEPTAPPRVRRPAPRRNPAIINLYRHFSADGTLLYVGVSLSAATRLSQHIRGSSWARLISRIEVEKFTTRRAAFQAERAAIRTERPLFNVAHSDSLSRF